MTTIAQEGHSRWWKKYRLWAHIAGIRNFFTYVTIIRNLPYLLFCVLLVIIYIASAHHIEKNIRKLNRLEREVKELRWEYITSQSELMYRSKQSEIARLVEPMGLKELREPPYIIRLKE